MTFNSQGLRIVAQNSDLSSILNQVSTETGAKVEGLSGDERVFGNYGPGQPREVISDLLSGANYNVLIVGDEAEGEPLHVVLSPRVAGIANNQAVARPAPQDQEENVEPPEPQEAPEILEPPRPPIDERRPMTPPGTHANDAGAPARDAAATTAAAATATTAVAKLGWCVECCRG